MNENAKLKAENYHHLVILSANDDETGTNWSKVFGFEKPKRYELGPVYQKFLGEKYPSVYRGRHWQSDFSQAVIRQHSMFFEIDGMGKEQDCFTEFYSAHGSGVCYLGFMAYEHKDEVLKYLNELGCGIIVDQKFPGGDWTVAETERLLGCNLCIKENPGGDHTENPHMDDFTGADLAVKDPLQTAENWMKLFSGFERIDRKDGSVLLSSRPFSIVLHGVREADIYEEFASKHGTGVFGLCMKQLPEDCRERLLSDGAEAVKTETGEILKTEDILCTNLRIGDIL